MSQLPEHHEDHPDVISRNAAIGLMLFALYFALYLLFLLLNVLSPKTMQLTSIPVGEREYTFGGPNLAVVFGIGLIFAAFVLAMVYMRLTRRPNGSAMPPSPAK